VEYLEIASWLKPNSSIIEVAQDGIILKYFISRIKWFEVTAFKWDSLYNSSK
jgi:hypothetical protein